MGKAISQEAQFGQTVWEEARRQQEQGKDPNQTANILCQRDPEGQNYGIGIILDGNGRPMPTSPTLLEYAGKELRESGVGTYLNSAKKMESLKDAVLDWQRIPRKNRDQFKLILPSDAGTGAVQTAVEFALTMRPASRTLGIEKLGWPAYKSIAKSLRLQRKEFDAETVIDEQGTLPVYQAGPLNTTGSIAAESVIRQRAKQAASTGVVVLDRAYSGFEFADQLDDKSYDQIMKMSFERQIHPFIEAGAAFALALSPTKAFVTFSLRPCGFLLVYVPDDKQNREAALSLATLIRARGSSFEHPITRAFVNAFVESRNRLEKEHETALRRVAQAQSQWKKLTVGTTMENQFSNRFAGLFRNPKVKLEAPPLIYNAHLYPVFSENRCRLNVTGLPSDEKLARRHVDVFARQCL